jgi:prepilin-type N-terminal cleavage/methylation domain-containing protein
MFNNKGFTLTEVALVIVIGALILSSVFMVYKYQIEPSRYISYATEHLTNILVNTEKMRSNTGSFPAVNNGVITNLGSDLSGSSDVNVKIVWSSLTGGSVVPYLKNWQYSCPATGTTLTITANFSDVPNRELINVIATNVQNNFRADWSCTGNATNKTVTCIKSNVICKTISLN